MHLRIKRLTRHNNIWKCSDANDQLSFRSFHLLQKTLRPHRIRNPLHSEPNVDRPSFHFLFPCVFQKSAKMSSFLHDPSIHFNPND
jgi:hypothetical protein